MFFIMSIRWTSIVEATTIAFSSQHHSDHYYFIHQKMACIHHNTHVLQLNNKLFSFRQRMMKMGVKVCSNFLWRPRTLCFDLMMHLTKTRYYEAKKHNMTYVCPMVVIDANLIGYRAPKFIDPARHVDSIASSFSNNVIGV